jgi:nitroreductase
MDVWTAILTRRSERHLTDPAPSEDEFAELLAAAATAPDHGMLRPWRWILVRGAERYALGAAWAADTDWTADLAAAKVLRAPLLATLVFQPLRGHRIPEWEQLAATSVMNHAMMLLLHDRGYGSIWRTGASAGSARARDLLGLGADERSLGSLYIGTPVRDRPLPPRLPPDLSGKLSSLRASGVLAGQPRP